MPYWALTGLVDRKCFSLANVIKMSATFQSTGTKNESLKLMFQPQETLDHPCDWTLIVEGGKEFKAHKDVLSKASPFFEKLLNSDMKEAKEGIIRLEMSEESVMSAILEFIYTGSVQTLAPREMAENLAFMADYLFLPNLKSLAMRVVENLATLNASNCISTYRFAELYRCDEILSRTKQFILANFTSVAKTNEFLNLSSKEVEMWISSDEIDVATEENVFEIILAWIGRDENERKKYFAELFRQVRLVYVSLDFLCNAIATNYHVKANEGCLHLVKATLKTVDSNNFDTLSTPPRKAPAIVVCSEEHVLCYFPREDRWCKMGDSLGPRSHHPRTQIASICHNELYSYCFSPSNSEVSSLPQMHRYDLFSNTWTRLSHYEKGDLTQIVVRNGCEIYGLVTRYRCPECNRCGQTCRCLLSYSYGYYSCLGCRGKLQGYAVCQTCFQSDFDNAVISRYVIELNVWQDITSFDSGLRARVCLVVSDNFIYFIGGGLRGEMNKYLSDVDRYNLNQNTWEKVADMREERMLPCGAEAHGKIFIVGGNKGAPADTCEVYNEQLNEWQIIGSLGTRGDPFRSMVCCDGNLYLLGGCYGSDSEAATVERYDYDNDEWIKTTTIPLHHIENGEFGFANACAMGIYKKFLTYTVMDSASVGVTKHLRKKYNSC